MNLSPVVARQTIATSRPPRSSFLLDGVSLGCELAIFPASWRARERGMEGEQGGNGKMRACIASEVTDIGGSVVKGHADRY